MPTKKLPKIWRRNSKKATFESNPYFQWLTKEKDRAIFKRQPATNLEVDLTILKGTVPVEELIVDFQDGKFLGVTISIFNRGDGGRDQQ